jgi:hypothetical protein
MYRVLLTVMMSRWSFFFLFIHHRKFFFTWFGLQTCKFAAFCSPSLIMWISRVWVLRGVFMLNMWFSAMVFAQYHSDVCVYVSCNG